MGLPEAKKKLLDLWDKSGHPTPTFNELGQVLEAFAEGEKIIKRCIECSGPKLDDGYLHSPDCSSYKIRQDLEVQFGKDTASMTDTLSKEATDQDPMIRALESSYDHWKEICKIVSKGSLEFSIASSACACCLEYCTRDNYCKGCPLKEEVEHTRNKKEDWCCGGRWAGVAYAKPLVDDGNVNFFLLLKRCNDVLKYIREKLDETRGEVFGGGDIVEWGVEAMGGCRTERGPITRLFRSGDSWLADINSVNGKWTYPINELKLILPVSKIPTSRLGKINCKPSGDIVKDRRCESYGMVVACIGKSITIIWWLADKNKWSIVSYEAERKIPYLEVIWPCGGR